MASKEPRHPTPCILFDLDGTLYNSTQYSEKLELEIIRLVSEKISVDIKKTAEILKERRRDLGTLTKSLESLGIDRNLFFESIATRVEPADYLAEDIEVNRMILDLKELGFKVALVSNSGARLVAKILKALRLDSAFEVIVTSSDAPPKPSTEPYLRALKLLNGDKARAIYVGDRDEAELYPAKQLGIHTILIDRTGSSALPHWADTVVTAPSEVVDAAQHLIEG